MRNRFDNAVFIQQGACNPSGIAHSIIEACREVRDENGDVQKDPAIRLMVHQLAFITKVGEIDHGSDVLLYSRMIEECEEKSNIAKPHIGG